LICVLRRTRKESASGPGTKPAPNGPLFSLFLTGWDHDASEYFDDMLLRYPYEVLSR